MPVFAGPVLLAALVTTLLIVHPVRETMSHPHSDTTNRPVTVNAAASLPTPLIWDAHRPFDKDHCINITHFNSGKLVFTIQNRNGDFSNRNKDHDVDRTFEVVDLKGDVLVQVHQKSDGQGNPHSTYPTPFGVSYRIDPRGFKTDRWYMRMEGNNPDVNYQTLKYYRGHKHNIGKVYFKNHTLVASFTFHPPKDRTNLIGSKDTIMLEILAQTNIGRQYFVALWALVKLRMDMFGP